MTNNVRPHLSPFPEMDLNCDGEFDFEDLNTASMKYPIVQNYYYSPFGEIWQGERTTDTNPFRYAGEYLDQETGDIYLRARYYDPSIGRFLTVDPIKDGTNWYVYCSNNPIAFVDPSGTTSFIFAFPKIFKKYFTYNRAAAVEYARKYNEEYNPKYPQYDANCTNYVSQCLVAGGLPMDGTWKITWIPFLGRKTTRAWDNARQHYYYFSNPQNGFVNETYTVTNTQVSELANSGKVQPGDIIYFSRGESTEEIFHSAIIVRVEDGEIYYMNNTGPTGERKASENSDITYMHIVTIKDEGGEDNDEL